MVFPRGLFAWTPFDEVKEKVRTLLKVEIPNTCQGYMTFILGETKVEEATLPALPFPYPREHLLGAEGA